MYIKFVESAFAKVISNNIRRKNSIKLSAGEKCTYFKKGEKNSGK